MKRREAIEITSNLVRMHMATLAELIHTTTPLEITDDYKGLPSQLLHPKFRDVYNHLAAPMNKALADFGIALAIQESEEKKLKTM